MLFVLLTLCDGNPLTTGGFSSQRSSDVEFGCFLCWPEEAVEQIIEKPVIWDTVALILCIFVSSNMMYHEIEMLFALLACWEGNLLKIMFLLTKGQQGRTLILAWRSCWANNQVASDLRCVVLILCAYVSSNKMYHEIKMLFALLAHCGRNLLKTVFLLTKGQ